jgi:hypothetical protein
MDIGDHHLWWLGRNVGMEGLIMNQPAFPTKINTEHFSHPSTIYNTGMTLRDYFAAKALQAILSSDKYVGLIGVNIYECRTAADAYKMADAMLKARQA